MRSKTVLAPDFTVGSAYGAQSTPIAMLIDDDGNVATEPAVGGAAVLGLLRGSVTI